MLFESPQNTNHSFLDNYKNLNAIIYELKMKNQFPLKQIINGENLLKYRKPKRKLNKKTFWQNIFKIQKRIASYCYLCKKNKHVKYLYRVSFFN